jgi:hypothetical protein
MVRLRMVAIAGASMTWGRLGMRPTQEDALDFPLIRR